MTKNNQFSPEVRQRATRFQKIGCSPETLRVWIRRQERDAGGGDGGLTITERQRLTELEREVRELRRSNDILRQVLLENCWSKQPGAIGIRPVSQLAMLIDRLDWRQPKTARLNSLTML